MSASKGGAKGTDLPSEEDKKVSLSLDDANLTSNVGTTLYVAPEVLQSHSGRYTNKVDMYSLGIILFEMIYPLQTGMERVHVLQDLRGASIKLPTSLDAKQYAHQITLIKSFLSHNPHERPAALDVLQSDLLPPRSEEDYIQQALRTIANPNTPYYTKLMHALFSRQTGDLFFLIG